MSFCLSSWRLWFRGVGYWKRRWGRGRRWWCLGGLRCFWRRLSFSLRVEMIWRGTWWGHWGRRKGVRMVQGMVRMKGHFRWSKWPLRIRYLGLRNFGSSRKICSRRCSRMIFWSLGHYLWFLGKTFCKWLMQVRWACRTWVGWRGRVVVWWCEWSLYVDILNLLILFLILFSRVNQSMS